MFLNFFAHVLQVHLSGHIFKVDPKNHRRLLDYLYVAELVKQLGNFCNSACYLCFHLDTSTLLSFTLNLFLVGLMLNRAKVEIPPGVHIKHNLLLHLTNRTERDFFVLKGTVVNIFYS